MLSSGDNFDDEDDEDYNGSDASTPEGTVAVEYRPEVGEVLRRLEWVPRLEWRKAGGLRERIHDGFEQPDMDIKAYSSDDTDNDNDGSIYHWARDHCVCQYHSGTDADPHNATKGFFYSF